MAPDEAGPAGDERPHGASEASEGVVEADVDRRPLAAVRELDVADDARRRQPAESDAGSDLEGRVEELLQRVEHLADVDERRDLKLRVHAEEAGAEHAGPHLGIEEQPGVPVEAILAKAAQRVDPAQRGQHLEGSARLPGDALEEPRGRPRPAAVEERLQVDALRARLDVVGVAPQKLGGGLGEHAGVEPLGRRGQRVAAVVDEGDPLGVDRGALDPGEVGEEVAGEGQARHAAAVDLEPLEGLPERQPQGRRHVDAEDRVAAGRLQRHVGLVRLLRRGADAEEADGGHALVQELEVGVESTAEHVEVPVLDLELAVDLLRVGGDELQALELARVEEVAERPRDPADLVPGHGGGDDGPDAPRPRP